MLQEFRRLPGPLQKQLLIRLGLVALFLIILAAIVSTSCDIYLWLPCAGLVLFFLATSIALFRRAVLGDYIIINGECTEVGLTTIKRHAKYLVLDTEAGKIKVMLQSWQRKISAGASVKLFVAKSTPIYEYNGAQVLYSYIAIEIT